MDNLVWYVCYGSNLLEERFMNYIQGGICQYNGKYYSGCSNSTPPSLSKALEIPYDMYYSNSSPAWKESAVCFLDVNKPGRSYARAWLINESQLGDIREQEGSGLDWYHDWFELDSIDGIRALTLTNNKKKKRHPLSDVNEKYRKVLYLGLKETFPDLTDDQINTYLESCGKTE